MNILYEDILAQPRNLEAVITHLYGAERDRLETAAYFLNNGRSTIFTGVASAAYLCHPAEFFFNAHGRIANVVYAADALYTHLPALKNANVVINTRSGETAEIVKLAAALKEQGTPFLAITNEPESTTAKLANHILWTNTRKDDLVSINVVTGMMAATLALAAAASGELDMLKGQFMSLPGKMDWMLSESLRRTDEVYGMFSHMRPIHLLYRGALKGAAYNGRLTLEEVSRTPAIPVEGAEFRQGPNEVVDENFGAFLLAPGDKPGELMMALANDIRRSGGKVLTIGPCGDFLMDNTPDEMLSILALVPIQLFAYRLAAAQGYEPGTTRYITKIIVAEEGIPNAGK